MAADDPRFNQSSGADWFPVVDGSHFRTTAEVREAVIDANPTTVPSGVVTVPLTLVVAPGEQLASVDVALPVQAQWSLIGSNSLAQGIWCSARPTTTGAPMLHCAGRYATKPAAGRYELVSTLRYSGHPVDRLMDGFTYVYVSVVGAPATLMDGFGMYAPPTP